MPKQNNCDDLKVESCVDDNGQTISGGDSYDVPTGRYVKHVVNVCETAGSGGGGTGGSPFDPSKYYTKTEVDALLTALDVEDLDDYYDKDEIDALVAEFYSKDEIDQLLDDIEAMNPDDYYTKDEVDEKFDELDTSNVSVVGGTFSALDDIKTQQDVNSLLYSMALKPPGSPTTVKTEVSGEEFATDNDLKNQKEVNEFLDERLTVIEES
jgi:stress-induced morphogen